jgi:hypothetical protein
LCDNLAKGRALAVRAIEMGGVSAGEAWDDTVMIIPWYSPLVFFEYQFNIYLP